MPDLACRDGIPCRTDGSSRPAIAPCSGGRARRCLSATTSSGPASRFAITTTGAVSVGGAERVVEHGAQVLLELGRARALDRPVRRVVRAHRELVHQQPSVGRLEQLDREHAGHAERRTRYAARVPAQRPRAPRTGRAPARSPRRRSRRTARSRRPARRRPAPTASGRRPRRVRARSRRVPRRGVRCPRASTSAASSSELDQPDALAVVAAGRGLEHERPADLVRRTRRVRHRDAIGRQRGHGMPSAVSSRAHGRLVLREPQRVGAGMDGDTLGGQGSDVLVRARVRGPR